MNQRRTEGPVTVIVDDVGGIEVVTFADNDGPCFLNSESIYDRFALATAIQGGAMVIDNRKPPSEIVMR